MMHKVLPLTLKKNKYGEKIDDISIEKYYNQIYESIKEAHKESVIYFSLTTMGVDPDHGNEAKKLADIITYCTTRLDIMHWYEDGVNFSMYVHKVVADASQNYSEPKDFYPDLATAVMKSYHATKMAEVFDYLQSEGCGSYVAEVIDDCDEESCLGNVIIMCVKRLEKFEYNELERQAIYQVINEKNRKQGCFAE